MDYVWGWKLGNVSFKAKSDCVGNGPLLFCLLNRERYHVVRRPRPCPHVLLVGVMLF